jgi:ABC-type transporter Mla subunit MlaD
VPVDHTTEPVNLLDLFNIFNLPTRQRFMVIADELGIGTAARGEDFNDILRRANPALGLARQVIGILNRQKAQLGTIIDATNTIAAEAAGHTASLQSFLDRAAAVSTITAAHRDNLSLAINRLPGLLAAAQPALKELDTVAVNGTPLVQQLHAAVPELNQVNADLGPFVTAAKPALAQLGAALKKAVPAIYAITPVVKTLRSYTTRSKANTLLMGKLFVNLQQHGFTENFLSDLYYIAALTARFDGISHFAPTYLIYGPAGGSCGNFATTPNPACSAHFGETSTYTPTQAAGPSIERARGLLAPSPRRSNAPTNPTTATPSTPATSQPTLSALLPQVLQRDQHLAEQLIAKLLQRGGQVNAQALQQLQALLQGQQPPNAQSLQSVTGYLLGR